ncbi:MAG: Gfo/Idh/MocA family oxidoreductase [Planctomycetes bacterium]|nr:Gfo/Idh/MocA family oxidoreductase [Planctomycetota bacterium]
MIRLGMLDLDTSHAVEFTKRLNHLKIDQDQWIEGAQVVVACPGVSKIMPERIPGFAKTLGEDLGIKLVQKPEEMLGKIDGLLLEGNDGSSHLERVRPFLEASLPVWIDKPLAWTAKDAEAIAELSAKKNAPVFSASSLRFAEEIRSVLSNRAELGPPVAVEVYGGQAKKGNIPGWFFYGIHSVEILFALLGQGHGKISYLKSGDAEIASCPWKSGALGSITKLSRGDKPFGFTYFGEKATRAAKIDGKNNYRDLLIQILAFFKTNKAPTPIEETIETIRYIEGVNAAGGAKP